MMKWEINKIKKIMSLKSLKFPFRHPQTSHFESNNSQFSPWKSDNFRLIFIGGIFSNRCGGGEGNWKNGSNMDEQMGVAWGYAKNWLTTSLQNVLDKIKLLTMTNFSIILNFLFLATYKTHKKKTE